MSIPYSTGDWDYERLGNHRAVVQVPLQRAAVRVTIPWRRRDRHPEDINILVTDEQGQVVPNVARLRVDRESGELVFQPAAGPVFRLDASAVHTGYAFSDSQPESHAA